VIDLSALTDFSAQLDVYSSPGALTVTDQGTVLDPALTSLNNVSVTLDGTGTLATDQWTSLTSSTLTIEGGSYSFPGLTDIDSSNLYVQADASLTLPAVANYTSRNNFATTTLQAKGANSVLSLPDLTSIAVQATYPEQVNIQASSGGDVSMPMLSQVSASLQVQSTGPGSVIDLSALTDFSAQLDVYSTPGALTVTDQGTVLDPELTSLNNVGVMLDGTGTLAISQWTTLTSSSLTITAGSYSFPSLTDIDSSNLDVQANASLTLPAVANYTLRNNFATTTLEASGANSMLSLPDLTSIAVQATYPEQVNIQASSGGDVSMPMLSQVSASLQVQSTGPGSVIDLSALTDFSAQLDVYSTPGALTVTDQGTVLDPELTSLNNVGVMLDGTGTLAISQWTTLTSSSLTITAGSYSFPSLTDIDSSNLDVQANASLTLPAVANYTLRNNFATTTLEASGANSMLSLPDLTSIAVQATYPEQVNIQASSGGDVSMPMLSQVSASLQVQSTGSGSVIDLSALTDFSAQLDVYSSPGAITVTDQGTVLDPALTSLNNVSVTLDGTGSLTIDPWTTLTNGSLTISAGSYSFPSLTDIDSSNLDVQANADLTLPAVANYTLRNNFATTTLEASGANSVLSLPDLTSIAVQATYPEQVNIQASSGGDVSMSMLSQVSASLVVQSTGSGSVVGLSALTDFSAQLDVYSTPGAIHRYP
jgi:uncharacterized protein YaeQ